MAALDALKASLDDPGALFSRPGLFGWQDDNPCAGAAAAPGTGLWTGVTCDYSQSPARVSMLCAFVPVAAAGASAGAGAADAAAALCQHLLVPTTCQLPVSCAVHHAVILRVCGD